MDVVREGRVRILVAPVRCLNDQETQMRLTGLDPGSAVTIHARLTDDFGREWQSRAVFIADNAGAVNVGSHDSVEGTYKGTDSMGLFSSMAPTDGRMAGGIIKNGTESTVVHLSVAIEGEIAAQQDIERLFVAYGWSAPRSETVAASVLSSFLQSLDRMESQ